MVARTRESMNGVDGLEPIGGVQVIEIVIDPDPSFKIEIGSPDEIENHDPIENGGD